MLALFILFIYVILFVLFCRHPTHSMVVGFCFCSTSIPRRKLMIWHALGKTRRISSSRPHWKSFMLQGPSTAVDLARRVSCRSSCVLSGLVTAGRRLALCELPASHRIPFVILNALHCAHLCSCPLVSHSPTPWTPGGAAGLSLHDACLHHVYIIYNIYVYSHSMLYIYIYMFSLVPA